MTKILQGAKVKPRTQRGVQVVTGSLRITVREDPTGSVRSYTSEIMECLATRFDIVGMSRRDDISIGATEFFIKPTPRCGGPSRKNIEAISQSLSSLRKEAGMTQLQLAAKAKVARGTIQELEKARGNPSYETLNSLASALAVTIADLLRPRGGGAA